MTAPDITLILCTLNRAAVLAETLASLSRMRKTARHSSEILLVDNGSGDATAAVLRAFAAREPRVRLLLEPRRGLSHARNLGIAHAHTPLVAFVDDDVDFDAGWLDALVESFHHQPEVDAVGGRTDPRFPAARPDWFYDRLISWYSCSMLGEQSRWMRAQELPYGVNMAFRREVLQHSGGFATDLGRCGNSLLSNDETELCKRLKAQGRRFWYCAEARLHHRISPERLSPAWVLERHYWQGISDVIMEQRLGLAGVEVRREGLGRQIKDLLLAHSGGFLSPRRVWWHARQQSLQERAHCAYLRGRLLQTVRERLSSR
jgi:glycosyltransferase involved in cell wall biosynthesis